jgi:uncharacterized protein (TIGR02271 family)
MTDIARHDAQSMIGRKLIDSDGDKIGTIETIYVDDVTGEPEWYGVSTGWFGSNITFVPVQGSWSAGDDVGVPYDKGLVKDAPNVAADGHLDEPEEERLFRHYGRDRYHGWDRDAAFSRSQETVGYDTSGPSTDDAMTRSEEELRVDTARRQTGVARLRKWIETEHVQMTVPVQREKAVLVTEPITGGNVGRAMSGPELSSEEHEVVLSEEQVVVDKTVVPKERVRLEKQVTTDEVAVDEEVRKERIAMEDQSRGR